MSVPNDFPVIAAIYSSGAYYLTTHDGHAAFVDAAVRALHAADPRWGHLKKKPGQTQIHGHAEDAALYKLPDGTALAVDFIIGAGGPNPRPGWNVGEFVYKHSDWLDPDEHDGPPTPPPPPQPTVLPKGEAFDALRALNAFYAAPEGLQRPGGLILDGQADMEAIAQWFYQLVIERVSLSDVFKQIRNSHEWRDKHPEVP
jgi:hypothetical protein